MQHRYDLFVIGGGSAGVAHARRAAQYGARVAIAEHGPLGGTCVNVGCVPKKIMWHTAGQAHHLAHAGDYGFDIEVRGHDWGIVKTRRDAYVRRLNGIYQKLLDDSGVTRITGTASFLDPHTVCVGDDHYGAERIVIATGGQPGVPRLPGADLGITSDGFFALEERPERVLVVGSGYVAVELAGVFHALGSNTRVLARREGVLRSFDAMLSTELMAAMQKSGIGVETQVIPESLQQTGDGIVLRAQQERSFGPVDCVLWAIGRDANTSGLGLDKAGVASAGDGTIPVDDYQRTNVEHIFALGDVTGRVALTPVAIAAGRRLADRLYGGMQDRHLNYELIPTVIFSHPPIGTVGMTEAEARAAHGDAIRVHTSGFTSMYYALSEQRQRSLMKLITLGESQRIIGCHVIGEGADEMLQGFAVAIRMGATKTDFDDTVAIHPTSAEEFVTMR